MINVPENELFSAYLDGELTGEEQAAVEQLLTTSPAARQLLDELRALSLGLQSLPEQRLAEDLSDPVLREAERRILGDHPDLRPRVPSKAAAEPDKRSVFRRFFRPRNFFWSALAVGVALMLMLREQPPPPRQHVALAPPPAPAPRTPPSIQAIEEPASSQPHEAISPAKDTRLQEEKAAITAKPDAQAAPVEEENAPMLKGDSSPPAPPAAEKTPTPTAPPAAALAADTTPPADEVAPPDVEMTPPVVTSPAAETQPAAAGIAQTDRVAQPEKSAPSPAALAGEPKTPAPAGQTEAAAAPDEAKPEILIVYCDVSPEVLQGKLFDQILAEQKIAQVETASSQGAESDQGPAESQAAAETKVFRVEVTPQQIAAVMNDLRSRPDEFRTVRPEPNREVVAAAIQGVHLGGQIIVPRSIGNRGGVRIGSAAPADANPGGDATTGAVSASPSAASPRVAAPKGIGRPGFRLKIEAGSTARPARRTEPSAAENNGKPREKAADAKPHAANKQPQTFRVRFVLRAGDPEPPAAADPAAPPAEGPHENPAVDQQ